MNDWKQYFAKDNIFFITPDVKRGVGFSGILPNYHIICSDFDPIIPILRKQGGQIFCLQEKGSDISLVRNSGKLLESPEVVDYIKTHADEIPKITYFKPSLKLDSLIKNYGFIPVGNNAYLNELFEDKINFYQLTQKTLPDFTVPAIVGILGELKYTQLHKKFGLPLVIQFGHGWAGKTTFFIKEEREFNNLASKFPYTKVKVNKYIKGFTVLNNCCLYTGKVLVSPPAVQIDGVERLGGKEGATCGRQWPVKFINGNQIKIISKISQTVGKIMSESGFKGFFGIDFLIEEKTGKIHLSEVNARMTASSAFFTLRQIGSGTIPLLAYHLAEFLEKELPLNEESENIIGSQLIFRRQIDPAVFNDKLFGVFKPQEEKQVLTAENYYPQNLKQDEYIFAARKKVSKDSDDEFARIETGTEVLDEVKKLKNWVSKLIGRL